VLLTADGSQGSTEASVLVFMGTPGGLSKVPQPIAFSGNTQSGFFVLNVASAGDVNGDGYGDVLISATSVKPPLTVNLYLGGPSGLSPMPIVLQNPGTSPFFGSRLAGVGDIDGDGFDDFAVALGLGTGALGTRQAFVYRGSQNGPPPMPSITLVPPASNSGLFCDPVAGLGDVNGDGFADVGVGSIDGSASYVYLGAPSGLMPMPWQAYAPPGVMQWGDGLARGGLLRKPRRAEAGGGRAAKVR
jgi:hypothetical protein